MHAYLHSRAEQTQPARPPNHQLIGQFAVMYGIRAWFRQLAFHSGYYTYTLKVKKTLKPSKKQTLGDKLEEQ